MKDAMTTDELSVLLGISAQSIRELSRRGVIAKSGRTFSTDETVRRYTAFLRGVARERGGESAIASGAAARARVATIRGDQMQFELEKEKKLWMPIAVFDRHLKMYTRWLRDEVRRIPDRLLGVDRSVAIKVKDEIDRILTDIATGGGIPPELKEQGEDDVRRQ